MELQFRQKKIVKPRIFFKGETADMQEETSSSITIFSYRDETINCLNSLDLSPDPGAYPVHAHELAEINYLISGKGSYLVEGTTYHLSRKDVLLVRPAETHKLRISPEEPYHRIAIQFAVELFDSIDPQRRLLRPLFERRLGQNNLFSAAEYPRLQQAFSDFTLTPGLERVQLFSRILTFFTELAVRRFPSGGGTDPGQSFSLQLVSYVNAHLFEELSLPLLGEVFSRSTSQIARVFRRATGTSLWEYVSMKRLLAAREKIRSGQNATEVCYACGFGDYSAFYRAYRKQFGKAPAADKSTALYKM